LKRRVTTCTPQRMLQMLLGWAGAQFLASSVTVWWANLLALWRMAANSTYAGSPNVGEDAVVSVDMETASFVRFLLTRGAGRQTNKTQEGAWLDESSCTCTGVIADELQALLCTMRHSRTTVWGNQWFSIAHRQWHIREHLHNSSRSPLSYNHNHHHSACLIVALLTRLL